MKVQCDMVQAEEEHGLLKFDFLGLRNLKIVTMAIRSIKRRTGIEIDVEKSHLMMSMYIKTYLQMQRQDVYSSLGLPG